MTDKLAMECHAYDLDGNLLPRLYGVSSGNGNNGVSHTFADYYVRTCDPWRLASLALVAGFKPEWQAAAIDAMEVDGEADYTISAMILDPLDDVTYTNQYECDNEECTQEPWHVDSADSDDEEAECPTCGEPCQPTDSEYNSYSESNGAWLIYEVFPDDEPRDGVMVYDSLEDAFSEADLALVTD